MAVALTMAAHWSSAFKAKDIERSYFVLNPSGDLVKTQKVLEPLLLQTGWDGVAGSPPAPSKVLSALQKSDFYLYFGHGGGQDVLSTDVIRNADVDSVTLLMGCSSGAFDTSDTTSSVSISLSYLLAGAPAVIANLWDVTDGDIELIQNWRSSSHSGAHICLSTSLQNARNVCQLKYLVGAAPVLFGIPTVIGISQ
jgi:separase